MTNLASVALLLSLGSLILFNSHGLTFRHVSVQGGRCFFQPRTTALAAKRGFESGGGGSGGGGFGSKPAKAAKTKRKGGLKDTLDDKPSVKKKASSNKPFVKSEQDDLIEYLAAASSKTCIGEAVAASPLAGTPDADPFWELMPSLISSRFPNVRDEQLQRAAGFVRHTLDLNLPLEDEIISNPHRPQDEIHAYMPGLGPTEPFRDPNQLGLCNLMSENYETIKAEYDALLQDIENGGKDRFQSVTSMNYESGWKTLVLFYNGHRIPDFPYHLCPTTTRILETVPLAGRIAGFNRQQPRSGIPLHTDGNNMWLTCQMGIYVPQGQAAYIRVGPETRHWKQGECLLYDTTYEHETFNEHESQERVVLHVDFFNTLAMTPVEIEVMQYIYRLREEFMKAEGVSKVGAQIL
jgi:aspartyl/asparaginyl beta-hydroxylase (cupin superfamily)